MGLSREEIARIKRVSAAAQSNRKEVSGSTMAVIFGVSAVVSAVFGMVFLLKIAGL